MPTPLHVHSLHALAYCERLFYLEEVENLPLMPSGVEHIDDTTNAPVIFQ
jgi:hypothetical protein